MKLTPRPTARVLRALKRAGWIPRSSGGSKHHVLVHPTLPGILTVPRHPKVRKGTLRQIIAASGLTPEEFEELYR
ncbi:MAG: type II toxin-antitoxin system HicA family toxin [Planctomycetota bacterium]